MKTQNFKRVDKRKEKVSKTEKVDKFVQRMKRQAQAAALLVKAV